MTVDFDKNYKFQRYDSFLNTWSILTDAPNNRIHSKSFVKNGVAYIVGGGVYTGDVPDMTTECLTYDIISNTWGVLDQNLNSNIIPEVVLDFDDEVIILGNYMDEDREYRVTEYPVFKNTRTKKYVYAESIEDVYDKSIKVSDILRSIKTTVVLSDDKPVG